MLEVKQAASNKALSVVFVIHLLYTLAMSGEYDELAAIIRTEREKNVLHDPETPYPGIAWLWGGDNFPYHRLNLEASERAEWYVLPNNPDVLVRAGTVQIGDRGYRVNDEESVSPDEVETAQRYLGDYAVASAYACINDVLAITPWC